jgi:hypothetical protein
MNETDAGTFRWRDSTMALADSLNSRVMAVVQK